MFLYIPLSVNQQLLTCWQLSSLSTQRNYPQQCVWKNKWGFFFFSRISFQLPLHNKCGAVACYDACVTSSWYVKSTFITRLWLCHWNPPAAPAVKWNWHIYPVTFPLTDITERDSRVFPNTTYAAIAFMFHVKEGNDLLWKLMVSVIFQKVTLRLAQRLFSADLYLFKGRGLRLSAITNALTNNWAVCHLEFI